MCITSINRKLTNSFSAQTQMKTVLKNNYDVFIVLRGFTFIHFFYIGFFCWPPTPALKEGNKEVISSEGSQKWLTKNITNYPNVAF